MKREVIEAARNRLAWRPGCPVWIVDSRAFPFFAGEVYHQMHCNFFASEGMPYPDSYVLGLWKQMQQTGAIKPTGCPESTWNHRSCAYG